MPKQRKDDKYKDFAKKYAPLPFNLGDEYTVHDDNVGDDSFYISLGAKQREEEGFVEGFWNNHQEYGYVRVPKESIQANHEVYEQLKARREGTIMQSSPGNIFYACIGHIRKGDHPETDGAFNEKNYGELADLVPNLRLYKDYITEEENEGIDFGKTYATLHSYPGRISVGTGEGDRYAVDIVSNGNYETKDNLHENIEGDVFLKLTRDELLDKIRKMDKTARREIEYRGVSPEVGELFSQVREEEKNKRWMVKVFDYDETEFSDIDLTTTRELLENGNRDMLMDFTSHYASGKPADLSTAFRTDTEDGINVMSFEDDKDFKMVYGNGYAIACHDSDGSKEVFRMMTDKELAAEIEKRGIPENVSVSVADFVEDNDIAVPVINYGDKENWYQMSGVALEYGDTGYREVLRYYNNKNKENLDAALKAASLNFDENSYDGRLNFLSREDAHYLYKEGEIEKKVGRTVAKGVDVQYDENSENLFKLGSYLIVGKAVDTEYGEDRQFIFYRQLSEKNALRIIEKNAADIDRNPKEYPESVASLAYSEGLTAKGLDGNNIQRPKVPMDGSLESLWHSDRQQLQRFFASSAKIMADFGNSHLTNTSLESKYYVNDDNPVNRLILSLFSANNNYDWNVFLTKKQYAGLGITVDDDAEGVKVLDNENGRYKVVEVFNLEDTDAVDISEGLPDGEDDITDRLLSAGAHYAKEVPEEHKQHLLETLRSHSEDHGEALADRYGIRIVNAGKDNGLFEGRSAFYNPRDGMVYVDKGMDKKDNEDKFVDGILTALTDRKFDQLGKDSDINYADEPGYSYFTRLMNAINFHVDFKDIRPNVGKGMLRDLYLTSDRFDKFTKDPQLARSVLESSAKVAGSIDRNFNAISEGKDENLSQKSEEGLSQKDDRRQDESRSHGIRL